VILGLTGSIGSGKTTVSTLLAECGSVVVCADALAREVVQPGQPALLTIVNEFGPELLLPDGTLDRKRLAALVFADPAKRSRLQAVTHPRIRTLMRERILEAENHPLIVLDIPLLFESGYETICTATMSVTIDESSREARLLRDRGMTAEEVRARLATQMPQHEKNRRATFIVDNGSERYHTCIQVSQAMTSLFNGPLPPPLRLPTCAPSSA
jgi:dephospho-CoA kinase